MVEPIRIVPYDPLWPSEFEAERARLAPIFEGVRAVIEHIGSTAVPGLGAKPIIDIMIGVDALRQVEARILPLEGIGYEYVPKYELELPERRYFRRGRVEPRTHHLHCVTRDSSFWEHQLLFREYLRHHDGVAAEYFQLKQKLAARYATNHRAYTEGKSAFVQSVLEKAIAARD